MRPIAWIICPNPIFFMTLRVMCRCTQTGLLPTRWCDSASALTLRRNWFPVFADERLRLERLNSIIRAMARFFWFTIEFGLMNTRQGLRAYGSGLLSSYGELEHSLTSSNVQRYPIQLEWAINQAFEIDHFQPLLFRRRRALIICFRSSTGWKAGCDKVNWIMSRPASRMSANRTCAASCIDSSNHEDARASLYL